MKTKLFISAMTLASLLGAAVVHADETAIVKEKSVIESMTDAVRDTTRSVKKAIVKDGSPESDADPDPEAGATETAEDAAPAKNVAPAPKGDDKDDAKDAEAGRKVSDTSIAIYSQNPFIQSVMEKTTHIKSARLKELMTRGDKITMLDIRPRAEFSKTPSIKGATLNIPRNFLEVEAYEKLPNKDAAIIIISTKGIRGGLAANTLQNMGYTNVRNLMDGLEGWNKAK